MAEFQEVMKQAQRMCRMFGLVSCDGCPCGGESCVLVLAPEFVSVRQYADVEKIVMDWAAAHPELKYPTWKEWQEANFPNNDALMRPCIFESEEYFNCKSENGCENCMNKPIPPDIAEKLGIKPIGGDER